MPPCPSSESTRYGAILEPAARELVMSISILLVAEHATRARRRAAPLRATVLMAHGTDVATGLLFVEGFSSPGRSRDPGRAVPMEARPGRFVFQLHAQPAVFASDFQAYGASVHHSVRSVLHRVLERGLQTGAERCSENTSGRHEPPSGALRAEAHLFDIQIGLGERQLLLERDAGFFTRFSVLRRKSDSWMHISRARTPSTVASALIELRLLKRKWGFYAL